MEKFGYKLRNLNKDSYDIIQQALDAANLNYRKIGEGSDLSYMFNNRFKLIPSLLESPFVGFVVFVDGTIDVEGDNLRSFGKCLIDKIIELDS